MSSLGPELCQGARCCWGPNQEDIGGPLVVVGHRACLLEVLELPAWIPAALGGGGAATLRVSSSEDSLLPENVRKERGCCAFKGSTQTKGNRFVIIPTGCSDIWPHTRALAQLIRENTKQKTPGAKIWGDLTGCFVCAPVRMHILIVAFDQVFCCACVNFLQISHTILLLYCVFSSHFEKWSCRVSQCFFLRFAVSTN